MTGKPDASPQPMPMDRAILWNPSLPGARTSGRAPYPIFFQQEAVIALQEHLKSSPTQAIFGFLVGDLFRDPESGVLYAIIDKTLRLNQAIYGDKTEVVVARLWDRMQQQLEKASGRLLGWYHSHPGQGGSLTTHDVETHEKYFTDPWHVAVLVAAEAGGVTGRFFRAGGSADWAKTPLPFYELLQPDSIGKDGKKRSYVTWRNYKAFNPPGAKRTSGPHAAPPPRPAPPPPPPEEEEAEPEAQEAEAEEPDDGFRIMRSSADDIPVIRTSADDEPAPAPPKPVPPPRAPKPRPPRPAAPVFVPDEPRAPPRAAPRPPPPPQPPPVAARGSDLPWEVTPESLGQMRPAPPLPREPRRTPTHTFRLLDEEAERAPTPGKRKKKKGGRWLSRLAVLLVLGGAGAGGYWYFMLRDPGAPPPWAGVVDRVKRLVSRSSASPPPPPASRRAAPRAAAPPATRPAPAPRAPQAAVIPPRPPVDTTFARFDRLSDSLSRAVRNFQDRAALFASGRLDCTTLASGLVAIENLWVTYNTERRARIAAFDQRRVSQDQALYAGVDSVESRFERSGCRRP
ncbi:MAG: hypothetical protein WD773_09050 [Gemmatimonadales bacterium]